jgi:hypothetical protein
VALQCKLFSLSDGSGVYVSVDVDSSPETEVVWKNQK